MNKKIKICFVQTSVYPLFNQSCREVFGGSEVQVYQIGKALAEDDQYSVSYLVGNYKQNPVEQYGRITIHKGITPANNPISKIAQSLFLVFKLIKISPNIVVQRTANIGTGLIAFYVKLFRKKFVYMAASNIDTNDQYKKILGQLGGLFYSYGIKNADLIIAQSEIQKKNFTKQFNKDSVVIKSVYNIPQFSGDITDQKKYVAWVGRCDQVKKPEIFLDLAEKNPNLIFQIICPSSKDMDYFTAIKKRAAQINNLEFIEYVPFDQVDQYFRSAKVLVNTSDFEGFPNTFVQAGKNQTPMLSLNANPDGFLDKYQCGLCANGDFEKLNQYLTQIVSDQQLFNKFTNNAYRYAQENHDLKKNLQLFKNALTGLFQKK